jgi:hypothetical protein
MGLYLLKYKSVDDLMNIFARVFPDARINQDDVALARKMNLHPRVEHKLDASDYENIRAVTSAFLERKFKNAKELRNFLASYKFDPFLFGQNYLRVEEEDQALIYKKLQFENSVFNCGGIVSGAKGQCRVDVKIISEYQNDMNPHTELTISDAKSGRTLKSVNVDNFSNGVNYNAFIGSYVSGDMGFHDYGKTQEGQQRDVVIFFMEAKNGEVNAARITGIITYRSTVIGTKARSKEKDEGCTVITEMNKMKDANDIANEVMYIGNKLNASLAREIIREQQFDSIDDTETCPTK